MVDRLFRLGLPVAIAVLPSLALLGSPAATAVLIIAAVAGLAVLARGESWPAYARALAREPLWLAIVALPLIGLVSALWSLHGGESVMRALKLLVLIFAGIVPLLAAGQARPSARHMTIALLAGIGAAAAIALTDRLLLFEVLDEFEPGFVPRRGLYSRGATVLILYAWLAVMALVPRRRGAAAALFAASGALVAIKLHSGAAAMVWALTGVIYAGWLAAGRHGHKAFGPALAAACLVAPLVAAALPPPDATHADRRPLPSSWEHRIVIWHFAAARIAERPLLGWGLDASRNIPGGRDTIAWQKDPSPGFSGDMMTRVQLLPLHPHSLALQIWLELGVPGALALAALAWLLVRAAARAGGGDRRIAGAAVALVYSAMIVSNLSYGAWQTWWLSTLWLVAAAARVLVADTGAPARGRA